MERQSLRFDEIESIKRHYGSINAAFAALNPECSFGTFYHAMCGDRSDVVQQVRDLHKLVLSSGLAMLTEDERTAIRTKWGGYDVAAQALDWLKDAENVLRGKPLDARVIALVRDVLLPSKNQACNLVQI